MSDATVSEQPVTNPDLDKYLDRLREKRRQRVIAERLYWMPPANTQRVTEEHQPYGNFCHGVFVL